MARTTSVRVSDFELAMTKELRTLVMEIGTNAVEGTLGEKLPDSFDLTLGSMAGLAGRFIEKYLKGELPTDVYKVLGKPMS